jgi:hypothetical protein
MPGADLEVTFPSGKTKTVFLPRLLVQCQNAEMKRDYDQFLPGIAKLRPTIKSMRDEYELDYFFDGPVKTWADCAAVMRHFYELCDTHIRGNN